MRNILIVVLDYSLSFKKDSEDQLRAIYQPFYLKIAHNRHLTIMIILQTPDHTTHLISSFLIIHLSLTCNSSTMTSK